MKHAVLTTDDISIRRLHRHYVTSDGRRLPVVSGGDNTAEPDSSVEIDLPDDLTTLGEPELQAAADSLVEQFDALHDSGTRDVATMEALAAAVERVRTEQSRRAEQAAADEAAIADLASRVHASADPESDGDDDGGDDPGEGEPAGGDGGEGAAAPQGEPVLVAGAGAPAPAAAPRRVSASGTARGTTRPAAGRSSRRLAIVAAADLPGLGVGSRINPLQVAQAMHDKARMLGKRSARVPIAQFDVAGEFEIARTMSDEAAYEVLTAAADPSRLDLTTLTAAGGWCVPSEQIYDLFEMPLDTNVFTLPTITVRRGGINVPDYIGFDAADTALWTWTEDDDIAALDPEDPAYTEKPCLRIPCPSWTEYRLDAEGLCLTHGNLTDAAFPENTKRFVALVMAAHDRRVGMRHLNAILSSTHSTAASVTAIAETDAFGNLMSALDLQVESYRSQHRLSDNVVLEAPFPVWVKSMIRSCLAMRAGVDLLSITDAQIAAQFASRKVRPVFVADYQPLETGTADVTPVLVWPTTIQFGLYVAGSFVAGQGPKIDLGIQRDSTLNATNDFTVAWTEQAVLTARKGPKARKVTADIAGMNGATGFQPAGGS